MNDIMILLNKKKQLTNDTLCEKLHCSISTLRRDLMNLEKRGLVHRFHGGVILNVASNNEYAHIYRESSNIQAKQKIAALAKDFTGTGMCIFLDSSSTVQQICKYLKELSNLVVITNGLKTAIELSEGGNDTLKTFIIGGEIKPNSTAVISSTYESIFNSFQFDLAIFSCRGIDQHGVYEASFSQAKVKKEMMEKAKQTILLVDHSKFDSSHFFKIGDFENYNAIITDQKPEKEYLTISEEHDVEILW
ncbi:DeoR/GlpR family DNA-binding transcription regulator [Enterococcus sp. JM9B]|uniref:DeoR/GlpR family DNA-binding transcription regulator n=1 Tax=Enterococcus sp. JM9B TaxID=1857216 RepID=UPI001374B4AD|nr:DeoR/GlpR family DNA-binding transcription regulator [Enterococcus sp. JM9B]KAF1304298.1 hypothetical protein BAU16_02195 [Enterococcus sp. JM9B]